MKPREHRFEWKLDMIKPPSHSQEIENLRAQVKESQTGGGGGGGGGGGDGVIGSDGTGGTSHIMSFQYR